MVLQPVVGAALVKSPTPTATHTPYPTLAPASATPTFTATPTLAATNTVTQTRSSAATRTPRPVVEHFLMGRPVSPNAARTIPNPVYLYGTTRGGELDVHHGEDFDQNPIGTPLYAVADGTVVTAGSDVEPVCGDNGKTTCGEPDPTLPNGYYGNLIVIQLNQPYGGQRVFALYGHVNSINVQVGDAVKQGDLIGTIGMAGVAQGPHLHFETRLGVNDYYHTRNPILWMTPLPGHGSLAGRYTDAKGNLVRGATLNVYRADDTFLLSTETYGRDKWPPVNSDDEMGENFAVGDLPVGDYIVRISGQPDLARVAIQEGKLSFVEIGGPP